ncbi:MAG: phosphoglycolate phosphatase [Alphaproteobacteria bacterium]|nr:phosphoglycolate phosphatase [Alphaproteobacteria bacterium]
MTPRRHIIIFDLDGTLVDTAPDIAAALNVATAAFGLAPQSVAAVRPLIGAGSRRLVERAFVTAGHAAGDADHEAALKTFLVHYRAHLADASLPFPGTVEALNRLRAQGCVLGVCTNKFYDYSVALLEQLGLAAYFGCVAGGDSFAVRKPDGRHITGVIDALGGQAAQAIMVGDSATDVAAARDAGVPVIAVSYGYTATPAHELGADLVVDDARTLPGAIAALASHA